MQRVKKTRNLVCGEWHYKGQLAGIYGPWRPTHHINFLHPWHIDLLEVYPPRYLLSSADLVSVLLKLERNIASNGPCMGNHFYQLVSRAGAFNPYDHLHQKTFYDMTSHLGVIHTPCIKISISGHLVK